MSVHPIQAHLPAPTVDSIPFWEGCNAEKLLLQRCAACGTHFYYARRLCPACGCRELAWTPSAGSGTVFSFSEVQVSFFGPEWASELPYTVVLVNLDEGPRMLSRLVGAGTDTVRVGDRVNVLFVQIGQQKLPFFSVAQETTKGDGS